MAELDAGSSIGAPSEDATRKNRDGDAVKGNSYRFKSYYLNKLDRAAKARIVPMWF